MKSKATSESAAASSAAAPAAATSVATRITGWTSNLLATGIVLVAALGLGRQLVQWWGVDAHPHGPGPLPGLASGWQSAVQPGWVEFGSSAKGVERTLLRGDRELALTQMRDACRRIVQAGERLESSLPDAPEAEFLERIGNRQAWEEKPGHWQIHQFEGTFPIVVGVVFLPPAADASVPISGQPLAESARRVLAWSLATPAAAFPGASEAWTIYTYRLGGSGDQTAGAESILPLPAGSRRTLALSGSGETMIGFAGSGTAETWQRHFDAVLVERGLSGESWQLAAGVWHARYPPAGQVGSDAGTTVDIQFSAVSGAELVGLAVISQTAAQR